MSHCLECKDYINGKKDGAIAELEKLRIQIYNIEELDHDFDGFYHCHNEALELINKRISELKGE